MIVSVLNREGEVEALHEGIAAVVHDGNGSIRLCRDGKEDEFVENLRVVVTPTWNGG